MADDTTTTPAPAPAPAQPPSRWTPQAIIGLLCLVAATVLRRVLDGDTGRDVADGLMFLGGSLVGWAPSLPPIKPPDGKGGGGTTGLLVGAILASLAMLAPGCASREVNGDTMVMTIRRAPDGSCTYRHTVDQTVISKGVLDECPAVPVCEDRP